MKIDPRIAQRLRSTLQLRLETFEGEAQKLLDKMSSDCRMLGEAGFPRFEELADKLERYSVLLETHAPTSPEGEAIRAALHGISKDLEALFEHLAALGDLR